MTRSTSVKDHAEHSLNLDKLNRQYYNHRLSGDLVSAKDTALMMMEEAANLHLATVQDLLISMVDQRN